MMREEKAPEERLIERLEEKGYTVTTAESCTGGLIAATLVNVSGVSSVFKEGYITYANEAKQKLLMVEEEALRLHGAVSYEVAEQMALGAARQAGADTAMAVTGIAGPDGGTETKPVGLVYIGSVVKEQVLVTENHFQGTRSEIRSKTVEKAIMQLLGML